MYISEDRMMQASGPPPGTANRRWWVLAFNLPAQPAYARVKIWRRLQDVGAAGLKNAFYLLPASDEALEDFEWILREVRAAGGDGVIFDAAVVQGMTHEELIRLFDADREAQYRELVEAVTACNAQFDRKRGRPSAAEAAASLTRFQARLAAIEAIDFFQANGRQQAHA